MLPLLMSLASAVEVEASDNVTLDIQGYYRMRGHHFNGMYNPEFWANEPGTGRYMTHKMRIQPSADFGDGRAKFSMMADVFDDQTWGDNMSLASTALFAGDPSNVNYQTGQPADSIVIKRAWMEFNVALGVVQVGRQPSNWGMGLLANDGDGFDDVFGDNHGGNTFDRVIFATKPLALSNTFFGVGNPNTPLFFAVGFDRLVEDPLIQYYGYKCDPEDPNDSEYCGEDDDHNYTEDRDPSNRPDNWWTEHDDDVWEMLYVLIYKGEGVSLMGKPADLTVGAYGVNRMQVETDSNIWIYDAYARLSRSKLYAETEWLTIRGQSRAIVLAGGPQDDPLYKEPAIWGGVGRLGYQSVARDFTMEFGYASGDDNLQDEVFTARAIHPDYNAGLLIYEEIMPRITALAYPGTPGLWSKGGVYNSKYINPTFRQDVLFPGWSVHGGFLVVWPDKRDGAILQFEENTEGSIIGWEADAALKIDFQQHMNFSLEAGYAQLTDVLPWEARGLTNDGRVWTVQPRIAYEF
jgi:hypothetical protein